MIIDRINLNHLRIFQSVFQTKSMTAAARDLHLTQSGVSQHVKALEEALGITLFDRIQQKIVPTAAAAALFERTMEGLHSIESALTQITGVQEAVTGKVRVGMPIEFGNNILMPLIAKFGQKYPHVQFELQYDFASKFNDPLLQGDIDFAFVDEFRMDKRISIEKFFDETVDLCIASDLLKKYGPPKNTKQFFESLDYVEYREGEPLLRMWFAHHLGEPNIRLKVRATIMDVQGIARLVLNELGAGLLPHHVVQKFEDEGFRLYTFKGRGDPLVNTISLAYLKERSYSRAAQVSMDWLRAALSPKGKAKA